MLVALHHYTAPWWSNWLIFFLHITAWFFVAYDIFLWLYDIDFIIIICYGFHLYVYVYFYIISLNSALIVNFF